MTTEPKKPKQLNFNTLVSVIVLAAVGWVGTTIQANNTKLAQLSERLAVIEAMNGTKAEQLNRIEAQMTRQQQQINDMALDFARVKTGKP